MSQNKARIDERLDQLDSEIPALQAEYGSDFWAAFAGLADEIEDNAGVHAAHVAARLTAILEKHGLGDERAQG